MVAAIERCLVTAGKLVSNYASVMMRGVGVEVDEVGG
jgi:hypothetical protein